MNTLEDFFSPPFILINMGKQYRTLEQFEEIADNCLNGNWNDAAQNCVEYGFFTNDLKKFNEKQQMFDDLYDIAELAEMAQKLRK